MNFFFLVADHEGFKVSLALVIDFVDRTSFAKQITWVIFVTKSNARILLFYIRLHAVNSDEGHSNHETANLFRTAARVIRFV